MSNYHVHESTDKGRKFKTAQIISSSAKKEKHNEKYNIYKFVWALRVDKNATNVHMTIF